MARSRVAGRGAVYHGISRVVGGQRLLGSREKERLRELLWQHAEYSGIEVITYGLMASHFHVLVKAFERQGAWPEDLRQGLRRRMGDVSAFMQEPKQRFSNGFNRPHNRFGALWAERFKSVLVEDAPGVVQTVAAYVVVVEASASRSAWPEHLPKPRLSTEDSFERITDVLARSRLDLGSAADVIAAGTRHLKA